VNAIISDLRHRAHHRRARHQWNRKVTRLTPGDLVTVTATSGWTWWTTGLARRQPIFHPRVTATPVESRVWAETSAGKLMVGDMDLSPRTPTEWPEATLTLDDGDTTPTWPTGGGLIRDPIVALPGLDPGTPVTIWWLWSELDDYGTRCCVTGTVIDHDPDAGEHGEVAVGADTDDCVGIPLHLVTVAALHRARRATQGAAR
jgi:hypothetical protein